MARPNCPRRSVSTQARVCAWLAHSGPTSKSATCSTTVRSRISSSTRSRGPRSRRPRGPASSATPLPRGGAGEPFAIAHLPRARGPHEPFRIHSIVYPGAGGIPGQLQRRQLPRTAPPRQHSFAFWKRVAALRSHPSHPARACRHRVRTRWIRFRFLDQPRRQLRAWGARDAGPGPAGDRRHDGVLPGGADDHACTNSGVVRNDGNLLLVVCTGSFSAQELRGRAVIEVDPATNAPLRKASPPAGFQPSYVASGPSKIWVGDFGSARLYSLDRSTFALADGADESHPAIQLPCPAS